MHYSTLTSSIANSEKQATDSGSLACRTPFPASWGLLYSLNGRKTEAAAASEAAEAASEAAVRRGGGGISFRTVDTHSISVTNLEGDEERKEEGREG